MAGVVSRCMRLLLNAASMISGFSHAQNGGQFRCGRPPAVASLLDCSKVHF